MQINDSQIKENLIATLYSHKGRDRAVTRRVLKDKLGYYNDRRLRLIIGELRAAGVPILFATDNPAGYYLPNTRAELDNCLAAMRSYIIDFCVQRAALKKAGARYLEPARQGVLI